MIANIFRKDNVSEVTSQAFGCICSMGTLNACICLLGHLTLPAQSHQAYKADYDGSSLTSEPVAKRERKLGLPHALISEATYQK